MSKGIYFPIVFLIIVHAAVIGADFVAPYEPTSQHSREPFLPPSRVHWFDEENPIRWRPFICGWHNQNGLYKEDCGITLPIQWFVNGSSYKLVGLIPSNRHLFGVAAPHTIHLMGTDSLGRDQFSRFLHGGRISLFAGLLACALSMAIGISMGVAGGFLGWRIDECITGLCELFLSLPWLFLLIAVRAALPLDLPSHYAFLLIVGLIGVIGWARPARLIRAAVLTAKERDFVRAARGFGASDIHILQRHILPEIYGITLTHTTLLTPRYILAEVTLTFLGLGVAEPDPSWGSLLASINYPAFQSRWWLVLPILPLCLTFMAYTMISNFIRSRSNDN